MAGVENNPELSTNEKLEQLQSHLNNLVQDYASEINEKSGNSTKKETFLNAFGLLSLDDKRMYRDYMYRVINNEISSSFSETIETLSKMQKLELYAALCNVISSELRSQTYTLTQPPANAFSNLQNRNIPNEYLGFKEPDFTIQGGKIVLKNGVSQEFGNLYTEYMGNGQYKLFLEDLGLKEEAHLVIGRNEKGGIVVYGKDGYKEFETQKFTKHIKFPIPTLGLSIEMNIDKM